MKPPFRRADASAQGRPPVSATQQLFLQAVALHQKGEREQAGTLYAEVLRQVPGHGDALHLSGVLAAEAKDHERAVTLMRAALALSPRDAVIHCNLGRALREMGQNEAAADSLGRAIALKPDYTEAHHLRGDALGSLKQFTAAIADYERVLTLNPAQPFMRGALRHLQMQVCDWHGFADGDVLATEIAAGAPVIDPFAAAALSSDLALQKTCAETWVRHKHPEQPGEPVFPPRPAGDKIRLGYFSGDFHNHATMYLMAEMLEKHDRSRFELTAFSFGPDRQDEMRQRASAAFDRFLDVRGQSDADVAALSRRLGIDIAVDLKGFTTDSRAGILACRAAPLQVSYLGFPGTMGARYIDYIVADATLIPAASRSQYTEKVVYLPNSYQVNDSRRNILNKTSTRQDAGLPENAFVFCCFNNNFKILPATFDGWMRILHRVEGSVLWLLEDNADAAANLRQEATRRGIDAARLVFAPRMKFASHLARHSLADLFLDTLPYNAHTTTSDALWAGLPVLTRMGESFASRVAGSLLHAVGLPELVTTTQERYEAMAIGLASDPSALQRLRQRLRANRLSSTLFSGEILCRHLEEAYALMQARHLAGLPPDHLHVRP